MDHPQREDSGSLLVTPSRDALAVSPHAEPAEEVAVPWTGPPGIPPGPGCRRAPVPYCAPSSPASRCSG
ncbi:hypothetical protein [Streptomyces europaeiscabiei]|uniref:hypothetical protein n=1 Tax=Streptomyces europaeiscabiei TaxID=146819 RepID=UPI0038F77586